MNKSWSLTSGPWWRGWVMVQIEKRGCRDAQHGLKLLPLVAESRSFCKQWFIDNPKTFSGWGKTKPSSAELKKGIVAYLFIQNTNEYFIIHASNGSSNLHFDGMKSELTSRSRVKATMSMMKTMIRVEPQEGSQMLSSALRPSQNPLWKHNDNPWDAWLLESVSLSSEPFLRFISQTEMKTQAGQSTYTFVSVWMQVTWSWIKTNGT